MHIHLPKPLHGWKEFLNEIFVIVVGVLIALGFEQAVEQWHWHHEIEDARETLHGEIARNMTAMQLASDALTCRDANMAELQRRVAANDAAGVRALATALPKLLGRTRFLDSKHWELVNTSGLLAHMTSDEKNSLSDAYGFISVETRYQILRSDRLEEIGGDALVFNGSSSSQESLLKSISRYRTILQRTQSYPVYIADIQKKTGIAPATNEELMRFLSMPVVNCTRFDQTAKAS